TVALKMIVGVDSTSEHEIDRFRAECLAVARLQHPNIVQLYDIGTLDRRPFFYMEFVDGVGLDKTLNATPQPAEQAARLVEVLARAVQVAHDKEIVHRDLKPSNILVAQDGTLKITDFGLAKRLDNQNSLTQTGAILGTPSYMAPEQAEGR